MNRTVVFITFAILAMLGVVGIVVIIILSPQHISAYSGFLINLLGIVTLAAGTFYGLGKVNDKMEVVKQQTNGTLSKLLEEKNASTETIRIQAEKIAQLEAAQKHPAKKVINT